MNAEIPVRTAADVGAVRRATKELAGKVGFDGTELAELDLAVSELAANLVAHRAIDGEIILAEITTAHGKGIEIVSRDRGPGIADVGLALEDHHSSGSSMGCGLGSVRRQADEFDIYSSISLPSSGPLKKASGTRGTLVIARRWLTTGQGPRRFIHSGYSRPLAGETANGDAFLVTEEEDTLFVAVADGLGHGQEAEKASRNAMKFVSDNRHKQFDRLFLELHGLLRKTRGVAMTMIRVNLSDRSITHSGIGNVEARVYPRGKSELIPRGGILGGGVLPRLKINKASWPRHSTLVLFTDGVSGRWDLRETPGLLEHHATTLTHLLVRDHARDEDDATVVVVKEAAQ